MSKENKEIIEQYQKKIENDSEAILSFKLVKQRKLLDTLFADKTIKEKVYTNLVNYNKIHDRFPDNKSDYIVADINTFDYTNCNHPELIHLLEIQDYVNARITALKKELEAKTKGFIKDNDPIKGSHVQKITINSNKINMIKEFDYSFEVIPNNEEYLEVILPELKKFQQTRLDIKL